MRQNTRTHMGMLRKARERQKHCACFALTALAVGGREPSREGAHLEALLEVHEHERLLRPRGVNAAAQRVDLVPPLHHHV